MTGEKLAELLKLKILFQGPAREITGVYAGDILSRTVSKAKKGDLWITQSDSPDLVISAHLAGVSAIIIAEGSAVFPSLPDKARTAGISVYTSKKGIAELTAAAYRLLAKETEAGIWNRLLSDESI